MKSYHELDCDNLYRIQSESLDWLQDRYNLSDQKSLKTDLWLKIDSKDFLRKNPSLISWFRSLKLVCNEVSITVVNDMAGAELHIDELPVTAKINVPIMNYHNVINEWYRVPGQIMSAVKPKINRFGKEFYSLGSIDINQCELIDTVEMRSPIVFNSQIPHRVVCRPGTVFPRVVLTCMFYNEPLRYLE